MLRIDKYEYFHANKEVATQELSRVLPSLDTIRQCCENVGIEPEEINYIVGYLKRLKTRVSEVNIDNLIY